MIEQPTIIRQANYNWYLDPNPRTTQPKIENGEFCMSYHTHCPYCLYDLYFNTHEGDSFSEDSYQHTIWAEADDSYGHEYDCTIEHGCDKIWEQFYLYLDSTGDYVLVVRNDFKLNEYYFVITKNFYKWTDPKHYMTSPIKIDKNSIDALLRLKNFV